MAGYELLERIGAGGMAEIFRGRATAIGGFEKPVAIKKILPHLAQEPKFVRMLIAEAKMLASLRHRNIVQIFDVGLSDQGEYFLVMEYVDGIDLGLVYDRLVFPTSRTATPRRLGADLVLFIGSEVCDALDHVHRAVDSERVPLKLIHRDVSPTNVMLSYAGEVKLTDFGISKRAEQASVVTSIKGKFAYMSPEQAKAQPSLDPTCDIFSLGIILYELLLGRRLFSSMGEWEALAAVREGRVPRPTELEPSFSRELEAILLKALAYQSRDRYPSAAALGAALRDFRYAAATSAGDPAKEIGSLLLSLKPRKPLFEKLLGEDTFVRIETAAGFGGPMSVADVSEDSGMTTVVRPGPDDDDDSDATSVDEPADQVAKLAQVVRPAVGPAPGAAPAGAPAGPTSQPAPSPQRATPGAGLASRPNGEERFRSRAGLENRPSLLEKIARAPSEVPPPRKNRASPPLQRASTSPSTQGVPSRLLFIIFATLLVVMTVVALVIARVG